MNLRMNNGSILFKNWTCGTQGQQHGGVSEHNNTYYHPSPAHLKMQWFIAFLSFSFFFILNTLFLRIWNGKLKLKMKIEIFYAFSTPRTPRFRCHTPQFLHPALRVFHRTTPSTNVISAKSGCDSMIRIFKLNTFCHSLYDNTISPSTLTWHTY